MDRGWLLAWLLLLLTLIPCRLLATSAGGRLAIQAGALLKRRLLFGALRLEPDEIRHLGVGHLLGRTLESGAVESAAITGGLLGLTAVIELILAAFVLGAGAGSWSHVILLLGTAFAASWLGWRYYRQQRRWTGERLELTHDLVERMVGHRTRLAQEARAHWNDGDDQALERYLGVSRDLDRAGVVSGTRATQLAAGWPAGAGSGFHCRESLDRGAGGRGGRRPPRVPRVPESG
jgi:ATP-binding cassette subfamily B protein